ncbi:diguanylate cyclase [Mycobacterium sp. PS03-16]|uniref:diguanylate cyclase domain-containing protein n=1 Tax=Mycobacterium sp. PS03-16 TaxID=2559611 RepID=UPI0010742BD1|nr:diguanylate cyclase [Mycobacterium sp. PS03-16]TFV54746.1 diguanylate cyclase [Mycobacterium sp. PS03-16]
MTQLSGGALPVYGHDGGRDGGGRPDAFAIATADGDLPVLRSLLHISHAVSHAHFFDEALEVIAEQARTALNAASVSISRWERDGNHLRTLINVGDLGPDEERWPVDERYPVIPDRHIAQLVERGSHYINTVDDPQAPPEALAILRRLGKDTELAVAIMHDDLMWGELWVSAVGPRRFGADDVQLLQAIAALAAVAIGRSELFSTIWEHAHRDPLTGVANRRALDEHLDADLRATPPVVLVCDLDAFKLVNDRDGHSAGDALLRHVAGALGDTAATVDGAVVARVGGDEFCVLLPHSTIDDAGRFADAAADALRARVGSTVTLSWGAAAPGPQHRTGHDLVAAADASLRHAKRQGRGQFSAFNAVADKPVSAPRGRGGLLPRIVAALDSTTPATVFDALTVLAREMAEATAAAAWSVSAVPTVSFAPVEPRHAGTAGDSPDTFATCALAERIIAERQAVVVTTGVVNAADDAAVADTLDALGYGAVLLGGIGHAGFRYLVRIYARREHADLEAVAAHLRVLVQYCAGRSALP